MTRVSSMVSARQSTSTETKPASQTMTGAERQPGVAENGMDIDGSRSEIRDHADRAQCEGNGGAKTTNEAQPECIGDKRRTAKAEGPRAVVLQMRHANRRCRQHQLVPGG